VSFWPDQRVVVTGGTGFVGRHLVDRLKGMGCGLVHGLGRSDYDLRRVEEAERLYRETKPTLVIHLAAVVGGIGANRDRPAEFFLDNLLMGAHVLDQAWRAGVRKVVNIGTVCAYPKFAPVPFTEDDLWDGYPEETNAPTAWRRRRFLCRGRRIDSSTAITRSSSCRAIYTGPVTISIRVPRTSSRR
jgi:GDP-L-fucose synthase